MKLCMRTRGGTYVAKNGEMKVRRAALEALEPRRLLSVNVLTWHNDLTREGLNANEATLTPSSVNTSTFGKLFSYPVTGQVYAQPLYVSNLAIPGKGTHNVILVATQNNDVYAFDADSNSGAGGGVLWHVNLGLAAATPNSYFGNRYGPYHDINPQVGITSTPVIDLSTNTMYLDAFTNDSDATHPNVYSHHIHALDITTGADKVTPMLVSASVNGNGVGGNGTTIPFVAELQLQRPALTLLNGVLYVAYSGYADTDPYHGWIIGFNESTLQVVKVLNTTPNADTDANAGEGGIWQTGNGLISDGTNLFVEIANGDFNPAKGDYSDSFLKIAPDTSTQASGNLNGFGLTVSDYFTPYNEQSLADADADLGSGGALLLPSQPGVPKELVGSGKQGILYLVNADNMGHKGSGTDAGKVIQEINLGHGNFDSPAYFNSAVYYHAVGDVLKKFNVLADGTLSPAPAAQAAITYSGQGATPSVSANGTANGIVWDIQYDGSHEALHAYDAGTLTELFNSNQNVGRDQLGAGVKFIVPTIADGHVFVGSSNSVAVFGLVSPPTTPPAAPSGLAATAVSAGSINLTWVDNSDNEGGFKIERSTDNSSFTQIGIASANATSYLDSTASPSTLYYYRIRATNIIGDSAYTTPSASATTPAATGAIYVYHFDAGSGTSAVDSVSGNNGTLTGSPLPQWVAPGKVGAAALSFSGDGTALQMASQSAVKVTTDLSGVLGSTSTLDVWVKTTQTGNNTHYQAPAITGVEQAGAGNDINWGTLNASGHIGLYVGDSGGIYSSAAINNGQWHNIAMTRNATTGAVQLYVDGVLDASGTFETGNKTSQFFLIGALSDVAGDGSTRTGDNYFNGQLDEVRIYNQVLSGSEIAGMALVPGAPTLVSATAVSGPVVHLTWTTPSSFTQNVEVDRKVGVGGTYAPLVTLGGGVTVFDDTNVTPGVQYFYKVKAIDLAGTSAASNELGVTPPAPTIVANSIFYNNSAYDGNNGSSNQTDTNSVATDKHALLPGQTATFANYTSYDKGINGIIIDVANLDNLPRFEDYSFMVGKDGNVANWTVAPVPTYINVYPGRGPGGSTQITIIWADNAIQNEWLQVKLLANDHTNLQSDDVFYYGNAIGESGNSTTDAAVDSADELAARAHGTGLGTAAIDNPWDYNRDKAVNTQDQLIARAHRSGLTPLKLITVPVAGPVPAATGVSSTEAVAPAHAGKPAVVTGKPVSVVRPVTPIAPFAVVPVSKPQAASLTAARDLLATTATVFGSQRKIQVWD